MFKECLIFHPNKKDCSI